MTRHAYRENSRTCDLSAWGQMEPWDQSCVNESLHVCACKLSHTKIMGAASDSTQGATSLTGLWYPGAGTVRGQRLSDFLKNVLQRNT